MGWKIRKLEALETKSFIIPERDIVVNGITENRPASEITLAFDKQAFENGEDVDAQPIIAVSDDGTASLRWEKEKRRR